MITNKCARQTSVDSCFAAAYYLQTNGQNISVISTLQLCNWRTLQKFGKPRH